MNTAQKFRRQIAAAASSMVLTKADWKGRSDHLWGAAHGESVFVRGASTAPGAMSNRIKRRDINAARRMAKRLADYNRKLGGH
jgi:guanylate kinase